jgi:hypothetical protein
MALIGLIYEDSVIINKTAKLYGLAVLFIYEYISILCVNRADQRHLCSLSFSIFKLQLLLNSLPVKFPVIKSVPK